MAPQASYRYLESRPSSMYKQLWLKGRHMRAEVLYRYTIGPEPETPAELAKDYDLPVDAVLEAIDYCRKNEALLAEERRLGDERLRALNLDKPMAGTMKV